MRIAALEAYGLDENVLDLWKSGGHDRLLPVQTMAIRQGKVLDGQNVVVFSPTSSGKTFVGEMAAIRVARQNKRVVYLVPQKALAEEKYREFKRRYGPLGIRVVISTRDRKEFDRDIRQGQFHIAVAVFEKMQGLLVVSPNLLRNVGLVVIDELQMLGDKTRGADLEILLTKIKTSASQAQLIGLSAVLGASHRLARWLGASLCQTEKRPVELRKGVLCHGNFQYVEHNSGAKGQEPLAQLEEMADASSMLIQQVQSLAESGEQSLVFCKSKQECVTMASQIAKSLTVPSAAQALNDLNHLEDSRGKDLLGQMLERGVAYHNTDLDAEQRDIVERWFRQGEIKVICSTTTLAMGLNLPARNVFIDPERWERSDSGHWDTVCISQAEYENISGRAGRLGLEREYGRAIIVSPSKFQARTYFENYALGRLGAVVPALAQDALSHHVLNLVASKLCKTADEIREILLSSYTGEMLWRGGEREKAFDRRLAAGLSRCVEGELIAERSGRLEATELGRLAAIKGLSVETAIQMAEFAKRSKPHASDLDLLELLFALARTEDGENVHFNLSTKEYQSGTYFDQLKSAVDGLGEAARIRLQEAPDLYALNYERTKRVKKALMLYAWIVGLPTRQIETRFQCFAGSVGSLGAEFSWLAEGFAAVARIAGWTDDSVKKVRVMAEQLKHGVPASAVVMASARVKGLGRERAMLLVQEGAGTIEQAVQMPRPKLLKLLGKTVTKNLLEKAARQTEQAGQAGEAVECLPPDLDGVDTQETPPEWDESFPPSDETGTAYQSNLRVHLDGRAKKRRHLVLLNEREVLLTEQSFKVLLELAMAAQNTELGWVGCDRLGDPNHYHQIIRRLKRDLKASGLEIEPLIENNAAKRYRLSVPPTHVSVNQKLIQRHLPEMARTLVGLDLDSGRKSAG